MPLATIIGLAAAFCTTVSFVPQVIRAWRTRSTRDLSVQSFATYAVGLTLWLVYGLMIHDLPLIAANGLTLLLALTILGLKLKHG
jgi:MtN3 and saliva related transmembrane protein